MRKQNIPFEEVFDLFAIRIILDTSLITRKHFAGRYIQLLQIIILLILTGFATGSVHRSPMDTNRFTPP